MPNHKPVTGPELALSRTLAGVTQERLAHAIGISRASLATWEGKAVVPPLKVERYRKALREVTTGGEA